jgi:hypothetical protein
LIFLEYFELIQFKQVLKGILLVEVLDQVALHVQEISLLVGNEALDDSDNWVVVFEASWKVFLRELFRNLAV